MLVSVELPDPIAKQLHPDGEHGNRRALESPSGFIAGILAGADKLTRIAHLRGDPLLAEVMEVKRLPSQSTLSRFRENPIMKPGKTHQTVTPTASLRLRHRQSAQRFAAAATGRTAKGIK